jgi:hypothetical protein
MDKPVVEQNDKTSSNELEALESKRRFWKNILLMIIAVVILSLLYSGVLVRTDDNYKENKYIEALNKDVLFFEEVKGKIPELSLQMDDKIREYRDEITKKSGTEDYKRFAYKGRIITYILWSFFVILAVPFFICMRKIDKLNENIWKFEDQREERIDASFLDQTSLEK